MYIKNDAAPASDNHLCFRRSLLEKIQKLIMTIHGKIRHRKLILTEKLQNYQHFQLGKLINMNIVQVKKYFLLIKVE